ncbi:hypothetical protein DPMN_019822 [Dreissena polymorpha]|uniref:Uncharacterized protein n=1 Tax=Dreissena polymorpha TaxID=45954 RepID=A0A9D4NFP1_DREPO|nr:hypothetical protein DPMN_019822 [Dreissena polymorpha]
MSIALKYVTSRVLTRKISLHLDTCSNNKDWTINVTSNAITQKTDKCSAKFHEDLTKHVTSRVLTTKNVPPSGSHFHYNLTINVTSRVETGRPTDGSVFQPTRTIF